MVNKETFEKIAKVDFKASTFNAGVEHTFIPKIKDCGRAELESKNPEIMNQIEKLRKERDEYYEKAHSCQKEIDTLYNNMSEFDHFKGCVIDLTEGGENEKGIYNYAIVNDVYRLSYGVRFIGKIVFYDEVNYDEPYIYYDSDWESSYLFREIKDIKIVDKSEYDKVMKLVKENL